MRNKKSIVLKPEQVQEILDALPCGVVIIEKQDDKITYINRRARTLYGMDPRVPTMAGYPEIGLLKLDGSPYSPEEMPTSRSLLHGEEVRSEELILARPDGTRVTVSASSAPVYDDKGEIVATIGIFDDITESKRLEKELARHRRRLQELVKHRTEQLVETRRDLREKEIDFRHLIESSADAMVVVDENGYLQFANPVAESLLGEIKVGKAFGFPVAPGATEMEIVSGTGKGIIVEMKSVEIEWNGKPAHLATYRDITRLKRAGDVIRALSYRLLEAQEKERRAIVHELHDEVGGSLTALKLALHRAKRKLGKDAEAELKDVDSLLNHTIDAVSTLSHTMRPDILDDLGLLEALELHFEEYSRHTGIKVKFTRQGLEERLPATVETTAYRIVQEALTNVARHANVNDVAVDIRHSPTKLTIQVSDRGCGFEPGQLGSMSSGISGMQDRAFLAGGELVVDSSPGEGTCVSCEIPLSQY